MAVCSLWHCPAGHPGWALPTTLLCGARTFLGGVSPDAAAWPTHPRSQPSGLDAPAGQRSVGIPTTATSRAPSAHQRTMLNDAGATRTEPQTADGTPSVTPIADRIATE